MITSMRCMPKRVCAIVQRADTPMLLVGDKFGDVYSLPLDMVEYDRTAFSPVEPLNTQSSGFRPSATEFTVHTKGNREALRQQQQQKMTSSKKREVAQFEHKLLLGHVSLLTDLILVRSSTRAKPREYILSADRDEHIRVSRGPSQAHIIEHYCLGHKEFVSKLCVLPWQPDVLVAGSGEPSLKTFDWQTGTLVGDHLLTGSAKADITHLLSLSGGKRSFDKLVVSDIWTMEDLQGTGQHAENVRTGYVMIALEG